MRIPFLCLLLSLPLSAQDLKVQFYCQPPDAEIYMVDTADHYLGSARKPLKISAEAFKAHPDGIYFRFERPGFAPRTTLDRITPGRLQQQDDGYRYPPDSLGPIELQPLTDSGSRLIQARLFGQRYGLWLLLPALALGLAYRYRPRSQTMGAAITQKIGDFQVHGQLGQGGMSEVYRVTRSDDPNGESVALKIMHLELVKDSEDTERFRREVRAHLALKHPGLPMLIDWGEHKDGRLYLVMELLEGETLKERLVRSPHQPESEVVRILSEVASALDYLHAQGFVHRDVKPSNIFCMQNGTVKLTDMGIAQNLELAPLTRTGTAVGTPQYISPEQISGQAVPASDQYALGVIAFEMLAGRRPFQASDQDQLLRQQLSQLPPSIVQFRPQASSALDEVLQRCLSKNPRSRYPDCRAAITALAQSLNNACSDDTIV